MPWSDEADYDVDNGPGPYDDAIYEPPWLERDVWGGALAAYLPASPRTGEPCGRSARAWSEFGQTMEGGGFWDFEEEALTRARSVNRRGVRDDALLRRRLGQARARIDADRMLAWMRLHSPEVGAQARKIFELYYLSGRRAAAVAAELRITTHGVVASVSRLRAVVGLSHLPELVVPRRGRRMTLVASAPPLRRALAAPRVLLSGGRLLTL